MFKLSFVLLVAAVMMASTSITEAQSCSFNCTDNRAYCGSELLHVCPDINPTDLWQCVTRNQNPLRRLGCQNGCQVNSAPASDTCIPDDKSCTCPDTSDHCGSVLAKQSGKNCQSLDPNALYQCEGAGLYPSWRWTCPTGCIQNGPKVNDTCDKGPSNVVGLTKIKHIVIFMQENRAFDNYYGTLPGVCNFKDPNAIIQDNGLPIFYQPDSNSPDHKSNITYALPFPITGPKAGCTSGGSNAWSPNHAAWNNGLNNNWPAGNTAASLGYLTQANVPFYFELADQFTIADKYYESIMSSTNPNRLVLWTGTIDARGSTPRGPSIDNTETPPFTWITVPELLEDAGISWRVYQDEDNFDDNALAWFEQYQKAPKNSPLNVNGVSYFGLTTFFDQAMNGTLPQVSWVVGPTELSEHPDNGPMAGQWLTQQVVNAVKNGSAWDSTVLLIDYDESGGFWDHIVPPIAPYGTLDEWINSEGPQPIGPGQRVPAFVVSPWSTGGVVFTEPSDHTSVIQFVEQWAIANGYDAGKVQSPLISTYRRNFMSDFTRALDFSNANLSVPDTAPMPMPSKDKHGNWNPTEECEDLPGPYPSIPYGNQVFPEVEAGYLAVRGNNPGLGRTYVFQSGNLAIQQSGTSINMGTVSPTKTNAIQQFIMGETAGVLGNQIIANNGLCLNGAGHLATCSASSDNWFVLDQGNGEGYVFYNIPSGQYLKYSGSSFSLSASISTTFTLYSV
ncbi:hypothetical protein SAMD00019534_015370 [Acytostelium subglobosum LB1]|uniref:hypothetical protein n=1 Tax=Acytostelium subglobosum LB1 TaxID=1410327 RepID=UPI00064495EA|nr:hypothetical protein SAMD00019534_015370 [Acytostelium subglobosum LB1]GAM18362.1 hypothetical protein SAMD00019534_015370 [Acytostelium subglobosum LB1]|eukprot:XP_012757582.1 hypothetical protein SAMD00019534_015370 [Acytostelium subglobosum LB1]